MTFLPYDRYYDRELTFKTVSNNKEKTPQIAAYDGIIGLKPDASTFKAGELDKT